MTKEAFIVPTHRGHSFNQRFKSLILASIPRMATLEFEGLKVSEADTKPCVFMENVSF